MTRFQYFGVQIAALLAGSVIILLLSGTWWTIVGVALVAAAMFGPFFIPAKGPSRTDPAPVQVGGRSGRQLDRWSRRVADRTIPTTRLEVDAALIDLLWAGIAAMVEDTQSPRTLSIARRTVEAAEPLFQARDQL